MYPSNFYSFSFSNEKWTRLNDLPSLRRYNGSVKMKDSLYIVGGAYSKSINRFNLNTRTFSTVNWLDEYRNDFGVCQYDEDNFIFAGGLEESYKVTNTCFLYNVTTSSFKQVGSLNIKRYGHVLIKSEDGEIFALGGNNQTKELNLIEKFNKKLQTWTKIKTKLKIGRFQPQAVAYKNFIFIIGGKQRNGEMTDSIEKFDTKTGKIETIQAKLKAPRCNFAIAKHGNLAYILGGEVFFKSVKLLKTYCPSCLVEIFNLELETVEEGKNLPFEDSCFTAHVV